MLRYQLVTPDQFMEAVEFVYKHFIPYEPLSKCLGYNQRTLEKLIFSALEEGSSWCAVEVETGEMVGILVNHTHSLENTPERSPTFDQAVQLGFGKEVASIFSLIGLVFDPREILTTYQGDRMLENFLLGVHIDHGKRGIGGELVKQSLEYAKKLGHTLACCVGTSAFTQKICTKQSFVKVKEECYATYVAPETNTRLFENVEEPHKYIISYVKKLTE